MSQSVKAFDPLLQRWFEAVTRAALHDLMNHPAVVRLRLTAMERKREADELNARHGASFTTEAQSKRIHQNAKRLSAQRKGGFINTSRRATTPPRSICPLTYNFTERLSA